MLHKIPTRYLVAFPLLIGVTGLFLPILVSGKSLFWGAPSLQFIPWSAYEWESMLHGDLPLWNPMNGMGAPLLANYQLAFFYPPNWITFIFYLIGGAPWMAWSYTLLVALHILWGGWGMINLARKLGIQPVGQLISGLAFGLSGYFISRVSFFPMIWTGVWLSWLILGIERLVDRSNHESELWFNFSFSPILVLSMILLAGHAQLAWYSLLLSWGWLVFRVWHSRGPRQLFRPVLQYLATCLLAAAVSAVQLLPTLEYLLRSQRSASVGIEEAMTYSYWPWRLLTLFAPDMFGNPGVGNYWGYGYYWEGAAYLGLLPILLAISTIFNIPSKRSKQEGIVNLGGAWIIFLWGIVLCGLILALGKNTPIFPFLYAYIPTFSMFKAPARFMFWVVFGLSLLAGIGADHWSSPKGWKLYTLRLGTAGALAISIGAFFAILSFPDIKTTFIQAAALLGIFGLSSGLLTLFHPSSSLGGNDIKSERMRGLWLGALLVVLLADLWIANRLLIPSVHNSFYDQVSAPEGDLLQDGRYYYSGQDEYFLKHEYFFTPASFNTVMDWNELRQSFLPNLNLLSNISSTNNYDPIILNRYSIWLKELDQMPQSSTQTAWMNLMDITVIVESSTEAEGEVSFLANDGGERVRWYPCAVDVADGEEAMDYLKRGLSGPDVEHHWLFIERIKNVRPVFPQCRYGEHYISDVQIIAESTNRVEIEVSANKAGWLFLADANYPGWKAFVDGQSAPVYQADYLFRAVIVDEGEHRVVFQYRPTWFYVGAGISALAIFLLLYLRVIRVD